MNNALIRLVLEIFTIAYGCYLIAAYFLDWTIYVRGQILEPGIKPYSRLFFLVFGILIATMASYYLYKSNLWQQTEKVRSHNPTLVR